MGLKRRQFLLFMGAAATSATGLGSSSLKNAFLEKGGSRLQLSKYATNDFVALPGPMPYSAIDISPAQQPAAYAQYTVQDDLVLPAGFSYDVIAAWGDPVGNSHFGYNNDYLSFVQTGVDTGYLTVNFEYISAKTWSQTYAAVMGRSLPFEAVTAAIEAEGTVDAYGLEEDELLKAQIKEISKAALLDQGLGVIALQRRSDGQWVRAQSDRDRRVSGISGLEDGKFLSATGPATAVFNKTQVQGYSDGLADEIIGTFGNCAGGTTPWGTVLSAEENIQYQVPEGVHRDGSSLPPAQQQFNADFSGQGNVFGLSGNKYGWIVEIDPSNPQDYGTKHTWLGRYRHEAVGIRAEAGKPLAFYSGCDRRGGHLYKFVSASSVRNPQSKTNSKLLSEGVLYAAKFKPDGTGIWIPLAPDTNVEPVLPSSVVGNMVTLPNRDNAEGGFVNVESDDVAAEFKAAFSTLGDLYDGNETEKQGAILIDAHFAANAAGATATARPEDTVVAESGELFIAFTSGTAGSDGGPDKTIFKGPRGELEYEEGWIMKLTESDNQPGALSFAWEMFAAGGEPASGGLGFANPDNLAFDGQGHLWMVTDMSTSAQNQAVPQRVDAAGERIRGKALLGIYGNNSLWQIARSGRNAGSAKMFAYGPMESELTGPFFTDDDETLFLAVQHPGEKNGARQATARESRDFELKTTAGESFLQKRVVPVGSNWPSKAADSPPKPAVVAIRRVDADSVS